jgi:hypothetical protein
MNTHTRLQATVFSWMGITFYRLFLRKYSWRTTYVTTTMLVVLFSVLQLILIFRINVKWCVRGPHTHKSFSNRSQGAGPAMLAHTFA